MVYKIKYDDEADILTIVIAEHSKLSHAEELGDIIVHFDESGKPPYHGNTKGQQNNLPNGSRPSQKRSLNHLTVKGKGRRVVTAALWPHDMGFPSVTLHTQFRSGVHAWEDTVIFESYLVHTVDRV